MKDEIEIICPLCFTYYNTEASDYFSNGDIPMYSCCGLDWKSHEDGTLIARRRFGDYSVTYRERDKFYAVVLFGVPGGPRFIIQEQLDLTWEQAKQKILSFEKLMVFI